MGEYSKLTTPSQWCDALGELLAQAKQAIRKGTSDDKGAVQKALRKFANALPSYADVLYDDAVRTIVDLDIENAKQALEQLESRINELEAIQKMVDAVSGNNAADAKNEKTKARSS